MSTIPLTPTSPQSVNDTHISGEKTPTRSSRHLSKATDILADQAKSTRSQGPGTEDSNHYAVALSQEAKENNALRTKAKELATTTSPIREEKVAELKARIASGNYQVDAGKILDGMLREELRDDFALALHDKEKES